MKITSFIMTFLLMSCSLLQSRKLENISVHELMEKLEWHCLKGEGRGQFYYSSYRYPFTYDAIFERQRLFDRWILAMDFSLHGEEAFIVKWKKEALPTSLGGSFQKQTLTRSVRELSERHDLDRRRLMEHIYALSLSVRWLLDEKKSCSPVRPGHFKCPYQGEVFEVFAYGEGLKVQSKKKGSLVTQLEFLTPEEKRYQRTKLQVLHKDGQADLLTFDLVSSVCH